MDAEIETNYFVGKVVGKKVRPYIEQTSGGKCIRFFFSDAGADSYRDKLGPEGRDYQVYEFTNDGVEEVKK